MCKENCHNCKYSEEWYMTKDPSKKSFGLCTLHWKMVYDYDICMNYQKESN